MRRRNRVLANNSVNASSTPLISANRSLETAWRCFDEGRLQEAVQLAQHSVVLAPEGRPHALAALGWFLLSSGATDEAQTLLTSSIGRYPDHAPLHWYLGLVHLRAQHMDEASQALLTAVTFDPQLDEAAVSLAWALGDLGRFEEAEHYSRQALAIKRQPDRAAQLGWLLLSQQLWAEAALQLTEALSLNAEMSGARLHLASALQRLNRTEEAIKILSDGLVLSPESTQLLQQHIRLLLELHRTDEAQKSLERLLVLAPEDATSSILAAVVLESTGDVQAASEHAERAVIRAEKSAEAWRALAQVRTRQDRLDEAKQALHIVIQLDPQNTYATCRQLGWVCITQRQYEDAIGAFLSAVQSNANDAASWYGLAEAGRAAGHYVDALTAITEALDLQNDWLDAMLLRGRILIDHGPDFWDEAVLELTKALALWPKNTEAHCLLATALHRVGRDAEALTVLTDGLAGAPSSAELLQQYVHLLLDLQRTAEAHTACHRLLKLRPREGTGWYLLSLVLIQRKRHGVAMRALVKAQQLAPTSPEIWLQTGWLSIGAQDLRTARAAVQRLLALAPEDSSSDILAAVVLERGGDLQAASKHAERAVTRSGRSAEAWRVLAQVRARQMCLDDAAKALHVALTLDPKNTNATYRQIGWVCMADHRFEDAVEAFTAAVKNNANDAQSWYGLTEAHRSTGKLGEALKAIKQTLSLREEWNDRCLRGQVIHEQVYFYMKRNWHSLDGAPQPSPMPFPSPVAPPPQYEYVICSLSTKSHLHLMRTMASSAREHFAGKIYLLIVDSDDASLIPDGTALVRRDDVVERSVWEEMVTRYNILELCCALKAYLMRFLAKKVGCPIVYLDADTYLMAPLHSFLPEKSDFSVVLTPHLLSPLSGERHADEIGMLAVGAYNGGMLVTGMHADGIRFLDWWLARVNQYAYDSREQGVFTDQKWLDLVPSFFRNVCVNRAVGLNVGHWRVCSEHDFTENSAGGLQFCGEPVALMHMSGFKPNKPDLLAQHIWPPVIQNSAIGRFLRRYAKELAHHKKFTQ